MSTSRRRGKDRGSMKVLVLGLDGATWDVLDPLDVGRRTCPTWPGCGKRELPAMLDSVFPPLSPVAWTGVMTGKNSGKHGVFEFLEYGHDPLQARVNSSRSIRAELALGDRRPARQEDRGRRRADELSSPARPAIFPASTSATFSAPSRRPISPPTPRFSPSSSGRSAPIVPGPRAFMTAATRPA